MVEARRLVSGDKTGILLWYLTSCLWQTNAEIFDEKSGQFQAGFMATEPENLSWHVVKFKANTYSHLGMFEELEHLESVCGKKGNFLTRSQDTWYYCKEAGGLFKPRCGQKTWYLWGEGWISTAVFVELTGFLWQEVGTLTGLFVGTIFKAT